MAYRLDYSADKLSAKVIKEAGYVGTIRYIDEPSRLSTKHTNIQEYRDQVDNGLAVDLVMQVTTTDADGGFNRGVAYAKRALAGANYVHGKEYDKVIFFVNDRTTLPNPTLWIDYLGGAAYVLGWDRVGAYGFYNAIDIANSDTPCKYFWQAGRRSDADKRPFLNFWQDNNTQVTVGNILCDRNLIINDIETTMEEDMGGEKADAVWNYVGNKSAEFLGKHVTGGDFLFDQRKEVQQILNKLNSLDDSVKQAVQEYLIANPPTVSVDVQAIARAVREEIGKD